MSAPHQAIQPNPSSLMTNRKPFKSIAEKMKELEMKIRRLQANSTNSSEDSGDETQTNAQKYAPRIAEKSKVTTKLEDEVFCYSGGKNLNTGQEISLAQRLKDFGRFRDQKSREDSEEKSDFEEAEIDNSSEGGQRMKPLISPYYKDQDDDYKPGQSDKFPSGKMDLRIFQSIPKFNKINKPQRPTKNEIFQKPSQDPSDAEENNIQSPVFNPNKSPFQDLPNHFKNKNFQHQNIEKSPSLKLDNPAAFIESEIKRALRPKEQNRGIFEGSEDSEDEGAFNYMSPKLAQPEASPDSDNETETEEDPFGFKHKHDFKMNYLRKTTVKPDPTQPDQERKRGKNIRNAEQDKPIHRRSQGTKPFLRRTDSKENPANQRLFQRKSHADLKNEELENANFELNEAVGRGQAKLQRSLEANKALHSKMAELEDKYGRLLELFDKSNKRLLQYKCELEARKNCATCSFRAQRRQGESKQHKMSRQASQKRIKKHAPKAGSKRKMRKSQGSFYNDKESGKRRRSSRRKSNRRDEGRTAHIMGGTRIKKRNDSTKMKRRREGSFGATRDRGAETSFRKDANSGKWNKQQIRKIKKQHGEVGREIQNSYYQNRTGNGLGGTRAKHSEQGNLRKSSRGFSSNKKSKRKEEVGDSGDFEAEHEARFRRKKIVRNSRKSRNKTFAK